MEPEIWLYYRGYYKVYTEDYEAMKKIASWQGCKRSCIYYNHKGQVFGWDLIFPSHLYNRVAELVGLSKRRKNPALVESGKKAAERNCQYQFNG
ncbi:MAG: hypothetical protein NC828_04100 [Candidatus Omnitrophica bacterium]|nr:hypothetical protein [Candidatus Omnitrophota bacterium]